jgi:hypothetical protein|tara:strand:- start:1035 stop:1997 length:963 start_codon:yes stop_codon:yes gene_type:complete
MGLKNIKKQNKEYDISLLDLLRLLDPSKTGKFMYLLLDELKGIPAHEYGDYTDNLEINTDHLPPISRVVLNYLVELVGGLDVVNSLHKFNKLLDRKLINKNDIQEYSNLTEIIDVVFKKELELDSKEFTPHQDIISDDDFLILKPLNIISSRKYGASTKWCTSSSNPETFYDYSNRGVLLYIINRKNNEKTGVYYELKTKELSWWDSKDNRVDGLMVNIPKTVKTQILEYVLNEKHPNSHYFNKETQELSNKPTNEMVLPDVVGDFVNPQPFTGVWRRDVTDVPKWTPTTSEGRIDELVCKTLEYHYTIAALKEGGEEIN